MFKRTFTNKILLLIARLMFLQVSVSLKTFVYMFPQAKVEHLYKAKIGTGEDLAKLLKEIE